MSLSPCLQKLPYEIIEMIIDQLPPSTPSKAGNKADVPIMHICPRWCTAYMRRYFSSLVIRHVKGKRRGNGMFKLIPAAAGPFPYQIDPAYRTLTIHITLWNPFINGEAVKWMQTSSDFTSVSLESVTTLIIDAYTATSPQPHVEKDILDEVKNIAALFKHIRSVTPNANTVKLLLSTCQEWLLADKDTKLIEESIADLVHGRNFTFRDAKRSNHCFPIINPSAISGLTSLCDDTITMNPPANMARWTFEVARHNAGTLRSLDMPSFDLENLEQLLFSDGSPIIYSSLVKMNIRITDKSGMFKNSVDPISSRYSENPVNHFPALKDLTFGGSYRMAIGYFFGPENRSLEYLRVEMHPVFPDEDDPSRPCPVNVLTRFYGLKFIKFSTFDQNYMVKDHVAEYSMLYSSILQSFAGSSAFYQLSTEFTNGCDTRRLLDGTNLWAKLQYLQARHTLFSFNELFDLLSRAPVLQYLVCALDDEPPIRNGIDLEEQPTYLLEHQYPLSTSLLKFTVQLGSDLSGIDVYNISFSALLLASLCPRLRYVRVTDNILVAYEFRDIHFNIDSSTALTEQAESLTQEIKDTYNDKDYDSDFIDDS